MCSTDLVFNTKSMQFRPNNILVERNIMPYKIFCNSNVSKERINHFF